MFSGVQAANDPIAPSRGIPREDIKVCGLLLKSLKPYTNLIPLYTKLCLSLKSQLFLLPKMANCYCQIYQLNYTKAFPFCFLIGKLHILPVGLEPKISPSHISLTSGGHAL